MEYRVLLIEANMLMLERLSAVIKGLNGFTMAARYTSTSDALGQGGMFKPNIILLDVDYEENIFVIPQFVKTFPSASIICLCNRWDAEVTSRVVKIGAKGCLTKPFTGQELAEAIEMFAKSGLGIASEIVAFFSPKGKSGKTTLIANLANRLATKTKSSVAIVDADWQFGDMALFFNLMPKSTIMEATRDVSSLSPVTLSSYFLPVNDRISVLCGTKRPEDAEHINPKLFTKMLDMVRAMYRFVLIDLPPAFNPLSVAAAEASDKTYMVAMDNGGYEINHVKRALEVFKAWDNYQERLHIIFTRVQPCDATSEARLSEALGYPVNLIIPNEYALVAKAADEGRMAMDLKPDSVMAKNIDRLATQIAGIK